MSPVALWHQALCDRVGIMTLGLMRTLGTPTQLRMQFDQGYKFMLAVDSANDEAAACAFAMGLLPGAAVRDSINGVVTFDVPKANLVMSRLFAQMEANKAKPAGWKRPLGAATARRTSVLAGSTG